MSLSSQSTSYLEMWFYFGFTLIMSISSSFGANILVMSILTSTSHHFWNSALGNELAKRGHNLTIISPYTGFKKLLSYPENFKFDLVIHDFTVGPCFLPFLHKFNYPPLLAVTAFGHPSFLNNLIGGHQYYAYTPHFSTAFDDEMSFQQRVFNFILYVEEMILFKYYSTSKLSAMLAQYFGSGLPSVSELEQKTTLAFVNTNPAIDYLEPLPENCIAVGGLYIKESKPLPESVKNFIDSSKKGVVAVSFGSNYRSDYMPQIKQQILLQVFRQLTDYHFLWKFESNISSTDLPKNVLIHRWLPLSDILADSNVKAIFFHGGYLLINIINRLLTTQEASYRAVPMIIMPLALDQRQNLIKMRRLGVAAGVNYLTLDVNQTRETRFKDQKESPLERAVWWVEWLLRNPNCEYLKSPTLRLGFISGNSYDIVACFTLFIIFLLIVSYKCIYNLFTKYLQRKRVAKDIKSE